MLELLVVARGPRRGAIAHAQPAPGRWGDKERPPQFAIVSVADAAGWRAARWDFAAGRLLPPAKGSPRSGPRPSAPRPSGPRPLGAVLNAWIAAWIAP